MVKLLRVVLISEIIKYCLHKIAYSIYQWHLGDLPPKQQVCFYRVDFYSFIYFPLYGE